MKTEIKDLVMMTYGNGITSQIVFKEFPEDHKGLGCCCKLSGEIDTYEVTLKKTGDTFIDSAVELHELGHIYLNQLDLYEELRDKVKETIEKEKSEIASRINKNCEVDFGEELLDQILENPGASHFIHNVAMDLEVNSKILGPPDIEEMEKRLGGGFKLVLPRKYHLPGGEPFPGFCSYPEYLILVIQNLDQFLKQLQSKIQEEGDEGGNPKNLNDLLEAMSGISENPGEGDEGEGRGVTGESTEGLDITKSDPLELAIEDILKFYRKKITKKNYKKDLLYLYNRGINRTVIAPAYKLRREEKEDFGVVFLVDVSGSMRKDLVNRIISTIGEKMGKLRRDLKYSIVCWSTSLSSEFRGLTWKSVIPRIKVGGGTRLALGIKYIDKEYPKSDILIVISDFCDNLWEWETVTSKITDRDMYGFKYGSWGGNDKINIRNLTIKYNDGK